MKSYSESIITQSSRVDGELEISRCFLVIEGVTTTDVTDLCLMCSAIVLGVVFIWPGGLPFSVFVEMVCVHCFVFFVVCCREIRGHSKWLYILV